MRDQNWDYAIFQDLGSSPASMEASKAADFVGCCPGNDVQIADAIQAYVQAYLKGPETWVQIPREHWPAEWYDENGADRYEKPVVRLIKALYGHPDSGTFWGEKCDAHCKSQGFNAIPDWPSCYYNPDLKCLLIVYVDDFKLAGPKEVLPEA